MLPPLAAQINKNNNDLTISPEKRHLRGSRSLRIALRTAHILGFSVLFGGHWFDLPREALTPWLYWTIFSGIGITALEIYAGFDWFLQLAGVMVLGKLIILSLIPLFWEQRLALLSLVMIIGSVGSHMPGSLRHFRLIPIRKRSI